ncbi:MAG: acyl-CoA thioesterase II [Burkholderiales bacterium]|nr:acyl-CoA thioesterase II [Burkholderiales bacterium]
MNEPQYTDPTAAPTTDPAAPHPAPDLGEPNDAEEARRVVALMQLQPAGADRFVAQSDNIGTMAVFGGQVLGQALMAAWRTAPEDRIAHSLHAYFLLPGEHAPVTYEVERVRDGRSFSMRRVVALQEGKTIFELLASFQTRDEGFSHQTAMPDVPGPEGLADERIARHAVREKLPPFFHDKRLAPLGLEFRRVAPRDLLDPQPREGATSTWVRARGPLPDDPALHQALLAYGSDHELLTVANEPHGLTHFRGDVRMASLDHAMWFHRDFRLDDWLLYQVESPTAGGARGLALGRFYSRDGRLVASVAQEGMIRPWLKKPGG